MNYHNYGLYNNIDNATAKFVSDFNEPCVVVKEPRFSPNDALSVRLVGKNNTVFLFIPQHGGAFSLARDANAKRKVEA